MVCLHGQKGFNSPSHKRRRARVFLKFFPFSLRLLLGVLAYGHSITSHWHEAAQTRSGSVGQRGALVLLSRFPIHIAIATEEDEKKPIWSVVSLVPRARAFAFCTGSSNRTRSRQSSEHCPSALAIAKKNNNNNDNNEKKAPHTHRELVYLTSRDLPLSLAPSTSLVSCVYATTVRNPEQRTAIFWGDHARARSPWQPARARPTPTPLRGASGHNASPLPQRPVRSSVQSVACCCC